MAEWAVRPDALAGICDGAPSELSARDRERIETFEMSELESVP